MISDNSYIQSVDLKVKNLDQVLHFYSDLLGFNVKQVSPGIVELFSDPGKPYLVKLIEDRNSVFAERKNTGLFHIAIRYINRKEMARVFLRLFENKYKFQGFSDHLVSESIYLADPEGNGIELYADKPKNEWKWNKGQVEMDTLPLDLSVITKELDDKEVWNGMHHGTDIGHIHLKVSKIFLAEKFYSFNLGFKITTASYPGALFLAADGYHHHIGSNIWHSRNGTPPPENVAGLINYTIKIPDANYLRQAEKELTEEGLVIEKFNGESLLVKDFDNIKIRLTL